MRPLRLAQRRGCKTHDVSREISFQSLISSDTRSQAKGPNRLLVRGWHHHAGTNPFRRECDVPSRVAVAAFTRRRLDTRAQGRLIRPQAPPTAASAQQLTTDH